MKILVQNTIHGLVPLYDADYDEKKRLKIGTVYSVEVREKRNYEFHKKYFALIACAWEYMTENQHNFFKNSIESFRKTMQIEAGHYELVYSHKRKEWVEESKSISFEKMDNLEFQTIYDNVKRVIFEVVLKNISEQEFNNNLINF